MVWPGAAVLIAFTVHAKARRREEEVVLSRRDAESAEMMARRVSGFHISSGAAGRSVENMRALRAQPGVSALSASLREQKAFAPSRLCVNQSRGVVHVVG
jgi:hypothetical protein